MEIQPDSLPWNSLYKIMIGSIVPRPIGWVSSQNEEGCVNLAPFSFFNAVCSNPPTLLFCPGIRSTDNKQKDTLKNVIETGEFVINVVTEALGEAMNLTSTEFPADVDEFSAAGLTPAPSVMVRPPRVAESPLNFECRVTHIHEVNREPGGGSIVVGQIVYLHIADEVLIGVDKVNLQALKPIGRLAGSSYCRVTNIFDMTRPPSQIPRPA
jgi:flavin reductase (DIM6/NTAB) family NADH-FMN oxidoreductase RutF